jgi:hypothetical protein
MGAATSARAEPASVYLFTELAALVGVHDFGRSEAVDGLVQRLNAKVGLRAAVRTEPPFRCTFRNGSFQVAVSTVTVGLAACHFHIVTMITVTTICAAENTVIAVSRPSRSANAPLAITGRENPKYA